MHTPTYLTAALFAKSYKALRDTVTRELSQHDLSTVAWTLLGAVASAPNGTRLVELADELGVRAPFVTTLTNDLVERGLIDRVAHQFDRRAKLLVLSRRGKQFVARVEGELEGELRKLLAGLTDEDLKTYQKVLETIIANTDRQ
jgi:MarR family transcriptional regulator for hemolysin